MNSQLREAIITMVLFIALIAMWMRAEIKLESSQKYTAQLEQDNDSLSTFVKDYGARDFTLRIKGRYIEVWDSMGLINVVTENSLKEAR